MRILYNEGRVLGLSAYEMFVRRQIADGVDPADIPSESEWTTTQITDARGGAMILKIAQGTEAGVHDYMLPEGTALRGDGVMYATLFEGEIDTEVDGVWATHVTDYGRLVENTESNSPITPGQPSDVPAKSNPTELPDSYRKQCVDYMRINSAVAVQPGEWVESGETAPYKLLTPNITEPGFVRISFMEDIESDLYLLITGFISTGLIDGYITTEDINADYKSGQFLGPAIFPWTSKIQLLMTTDSLKGYIDWYLDATLTTAEYQALPVKENKFYFTRKE